jgi:hypothetical protein
VPRSDITLRIRRLGDPDDHPEIASLTPDQRLELVEQLTSEAWALTGRPFPIHARGAAPVLLLGLNQDRPGS